MYLTQSAITGNFSWKGFGKTILMGAVTGAISGGISHVFSVSSFWGTVGVGALSGGVSGGVEALINGTNFMQGVVKGAVIGGAVAGISYTIDYFVKYGGEKVYTETYLEDIGNYASDEVEVLSTNPEKTLIELRNRNFTLAEKIEYGVGGDYVNFESFNNSTGLLPSGALARTSKPNFFSGMSKIYYSKYALERPELLAKTMLHETGHAYGFKIRGLLRTTGFRKAFDNIIDKRLNHIEHVAIKQLEWTAVKVNNFSQNLKSMNLVSEKVLKEAIDNFGKKQLQTYELLYRLYTPVFNRKIK